MKITYTNWNPDLDELERIIRYDPEQIDMRVTALALIFLLRKERENK